MVSFVALAEQWRSTRWRLLGFNAAAICTDSPPFALLCPRALLCLPPDRAAAVLQYCKLSLRIPLLPSSLAAVLSPLLSTPHRRHLAACSARRLSYSPQPPFVCARTSPHPAHSLRAPSARARTHAHEPFALVRRCRRRGAECAPARVGLGPSFRSAAPIRPSRARRAGAGCRDSDGRPGAGRVGRGGSARLVARRGLRCRAGSCRDGRCCGGRSAVGVYGTGRALAAMRGYRRELFERRPSGCACLRARESMRSLCSSPFA